MKKIFLIIVFYILALREVGAMTPGVYLSPPFKDIKIEGKNKESSFEMLVGNNSPMAQVIELSVVDFGSLDESGGVAFLATREPGEVKKYALASWISLQKNRLNLAPGTKETVKITIINKDSLSPGGHYGAVLATVKTDDTTVGDMVGINQSLSSLIYVLKKGGEIYNLSLKGMTVPRSWFSLGSEVETKFQNSGNVHVVPKGYLSVVNFAEKEVARGVINDGSFKVLPESMRNIKIILKKFQWWNWPGKYRLTAYYRHDSDAEFNKKSVDVIYFGFEGIILTVLGSGLVAAAGVKLWPKIFRKK